MGRILIFVMKCMQIPIQCKRDCGKKKKKIRPHEWQSANWGYLISELMACKEAGEAAVGVLMENLHCIVPR